MMEKASVSMFLSKPLPKTFSFTANPREFFTSTQLSRNGMAFTPTQRYPWENEVTMPCEKVFAKPAENMPILQQQSHVAELIQEWLVGWSKRPYLTSQRMLISKSKRNRPNNRIGLS